MMQKLPTFNFKCVEDTSQFNQGFIMNYDKKTEVSYILKVDVKYSQKLYELHRDLPFLPEERNLEMSKSSLLTYKMKVNILLR